MVTPNTPPTIKVHAAPIARFAGHVFGGIALYVDPFVTRILYGAKPFILFVHVVFSVTFIGTSGLSPLRRSFLRLGRCGGARLIPSRTSNTPAGKPHWWKRRGAFCFL